MNTETYKELQQIVDIMLDEIRNIKDNMLEDIYDSAFDEEMTDGFVMKKLCYKAGRIYSLNQMHNEIQRTLKHAEVTE